MKNHAIVTALSLLIAVLTPMTLEAQGQVRCETDEVGDPPRVVYQCAGGVILEAEAAASLGILSAGSEGRPMDVEVSSDAVLIEITPGSGLFQIRTPHAIAAVRGTVYLVDVSGGSTSVFVSEGEVAVSRIDGSDTVILKAGFGADVRPGEPFAAREWHQNRVTELLRRFGR
ncbi:FecR family protein [Roseibium polysiphoniae]|nr:FecR family protein [Roseibium polysiphoniae]